MPDSNFNFLLRIYWEDTDAGGIVYYANYLKFFERARTEWMREQDQVLLVVSEVQAKYLRSAKLDDELLVTTSIQDIKRASITLEQKAYRHNNPQELLCQAVVKIGSIHAQTMMPTRFPPTLAKALTTPL